jgi:uncharacterized cupredoxin-like copper-binding protein
MRDSRIRVLSLVAVCAIALGASACGGGGNSVDAALANFSITLDKSSASSGDVTFKLKNNGPSIHEFVVMKTDLAPDALPTTQDNGVTIVDEEGQGIEPIDEVEDIANGASPDLKVNLQPGKYVLLCNRSEDGGHYDQGMHTAFTITS